MERRSFLKLAGAGAVGFWFAGWDLALGQDARGAEWQTYEVTTTVDLAAGSGVERVWVPLPLAERTPFQRVLETKVECEGGRTQTESLGARQGAVVRAEFQGGEQGRLEVVSRVATRDWRVALRGPGQGARLRAGEAERYLAATEYVPTDGVVRARAEAITRGAGSALEKVQAVYAWVVDNTHREAKVRGCGRGNVRARLETGDLGGKCADINGLFVGLARAAGVPARDVYGVRVGPSEQEFVCLGTKGGVSTKAQHCRAEVWLERYGWVPMDPADVRKVMLEEPPGGMTLASEKVQAAREQMLGGWGMNWMAYNTAQDVRLPGSEGPALPFFMYPVAETAEGRLDSLDAEGFRYGIVARRV